MTENLDIYICYPIFLYVQEISVSLKMGGQERIKPWFGSVRGKILEHLKLNLSFVRWMILEYLIIWDEPGNKMMGTFTKLEIGFNWMRRFSVIVNWSNLKQRYESQETPRITGFSSCASVRAAFTNFYKLWSLYYNICIRLEPIYVAYLPFLNQATACTKVGSFSQIDIRIFFFLHNSSGVFKWKLYILIH